MLNSHNIRDQIRNILAEQEGRYDVQAITDELIANYSLTGDNPPDTLDNLGDVFWDVVLRHDLDNNEGEQS